MSERDSTSEDSVEEYNVEDLIEFIEANEPVTAGELAELMGMDPRRLEENLEKLAGRGVVVSMHRADGRVWMKRDSRS